MATSKDADTGSDHITKLCNFCESNVSDGFCGDCEDHMCQSCFDIHTKAKACRHHVLLDSTCQKGNTNICSESCKLHPSMIIKFYCVAHRIVGCVECFFPEHRNCNYQEIETAAQLFQDSGEDTRLKREIRRLENTHSEFIRQFEEDKEIVAVMNNTVVKRVKSFTDSVKTNVAQNEKHMLEKSESLHIANETQLNRRSGDLDSVGTDIEKCKMPLENEDRVDRLFISAIEIGPVIEQLRKNIASIGHQHVVTKYEFQPNKLIMEMTDGSGSFGEIRILPNGENEKYTHESTHSAPYEITPSTNTAPPVATQSTATVLTWTTQPTVSTPAGTTQPTISTPAGTTQPTVSTPAGTTQPTISTPAGTTKSTVSTPTGTTQPTVSTPAGTTQSTVSTPTWTTHPSVSINGKKPKPAPRSHTEVPGQHSDGVSTSNPGKQTENESGQTSLVRPPRKPRSNKSSDEDPQSKTKEEHNPKQGESKGTKHVCEFVIVNKEECDGAYNTSSSDKDVESIQQQDLKNSECSRSITYGKQNERLTTQSTVSTQAGLTQPTVSTPAGTTQPTVSTPAGTTQPTVSTPAGTTHPTVSTPAGTKQLTVSTPAGTTQPTVSTPAGTTQSTVSTLAGTTQPTVSTPAGTKHATDSAFKNTTHDAAANSKSNNSPYSASNSSNVDEAESKQQDVSNDSDGIEVLNSSEEEEARGNLESKPPPIKYMAESISSSHEENLNEYKEETTNCSENGNENVAAELKSPPAAEKKITFSLKPVPGGKFYLIKSDACFKHFRYKPQSEEVSIDEDVLYDGDRCFTIIVEDGKIKLDEIVDAETLNSTPEKATSSQDQSQSTSSNASGGGCAGVGSAKSVDPSGSEDGSGNDSSVNELSDKLNKMSVKDEVMPWNEQQHTEEKIFLITAAESDRNLVLHVRTSLSKQSGKDTCHMFGCRTMDVYLRWKMALKDTSTFQRIVMKMPIAQKYQLDVTSQNAALKIEVPVGLTFTQETLLRVVSEVVDGIVEDTKIYSCEGINLEGDDSEKVLTELQQCRLSGDRQLVEIYDKKEDKLWILCHPKVKDHVMGMVEKARKAIQMKTHQMPKTLRVKYCLHQRLNDQQFKEKFKQSFSSVEIKHAKMPEENIVIVTLRSAIADALQDASKWIYNLEYEFAVCTLKYSDHGGRVSGDLMTEFLNMSFESKDIKHETNEEVHTVWIWSSSLNQTDLDMRTKKARYNINNDKVFKRVSLPIGNIGKKNAIEKTKTKNDKFVRIDCKENEVVISGLCYLVDRIQRELNIETGSSETDFESPSKCYIKEQYLTSVNKVNLSGQNTGSSPETNITADEQQKRFMEPDQQDMDRGATGTAVKPGAMAKLSWNTDRLLVFEDHKVLLSVTNIPKYTTRGDLLKDLRCSRKTGPRLAYLKESGKALLIFNNTGDTDSYFKDRPEKYQCNRVTKMGLGNISWCVNIAVWKKLGADATDKLEQDWKEIGVTVTKDNRVLKAPTAYQMGVAKRILDEFVANKERECEIADVSALVWKAVKALHRQTITDIEKKCGNRKIFSEEEAVLRFPAMDKSLEKCITIFRKAIDDMKNKEIIDITLKEEEMEKGEDACKHMGSECCIFDNTSKTVFIYCDSYDALQKQKFQFEIKIGRKKTTARGDRSKAQVVDQSSSENQNTGDANMHRSILEKKTFITEGIKVMVYKADILRLDVDCIVNAANSQLQHGGGVARVISKAAGHNFEDESKQYIHDHGKLPVGQACYTTAGKLHYKYVIHTVGPAWHDYDTRSYGGRKECKDTLKLAVLNSFYEAEKLQLKSIALPAISSAIFGVPIEVCVKQYVKAVQVYSNNKNTSALSEIHFIDVRKDTVQAIEDAFAKSFTQAGTRARAVSDDFQENVNNSKSEELPEPLMFESNLFKYEFYFMGNTDKNVLLLQNKDIEHIRNTSAVVVPVDQSGNCGVIGKTIEAKVTYEQFLQTKKGLFKSEKLVGSIVQNAGYGCGFMFVLYAVYPHSEKNKAKAEREKSLANTVKSALKFADKDDKIQSVVIPIFGIDSKEDSEVQLFSSVFVKTYRQFCQEKLKESHQKPLTVIVVCHEGRVYNVAQCAFVEYVKGLKSGCAGAMAEDTKLFQKHTDMSEDKSLELCVICMDTVTDPKTIQCGHTFCTECIDQQFTYQKKCPTCGKHCGVITGDQPDGNMTDHVYQYKHLPGFENYGTIYITYNFPHGKQQSCHPSPGCSYKGITRTAYLPDNEEGRKILKMLKIAFDRKLTFTIGNSRTTGQEGVITWNDIHHKTDHRSHTQFGYPDPTYLERVKDELAAKGVTEEDI